MYLLLFRTITPYLNNLFCQIPRWIDELTLFSGDHLTRITIRGAILTMSLEATKTSVEEENKLVVR